MLPTDAGGDSVVFAPSSVRTIRHAVTRVFACSPSRVRSEESPLLMFDIVSSLLTSLPARNLKTTDPFGKQKTKVLQTHFFARGNYMDEVHCVTRLATDLSRATVVFLRAFHVLGTPLGEDGGDCTLGGASAFDPLQQKVAPKLILAQWNDLGISGDVAHCVGGPALGPLGDGIIPPGGDQSERQRIMFLLEMIAFDALLLYHYCDVPHYDPFTAQVSRTIGHWNIAASLHAHNLLLSLTKLIRILNPTGNDTHHHAPHQWEGVMEAAEKLFLIIKMLEIFYRKRGAAKVMVQTCGPVLDEVFFQQDWAKELKRKTHSLINQVREEGRGQDDEVQQVEQNTAARRLLEAYDKRLGSLLFILDISNPSLRDRFVTPKGLIGGTTGVQKILENVRQKSTSVGSDTSTGQDGQPSQLREIQVRLRHSANRIPILLFQCRELLSWSDEYAYAMQQTDGQQGIDFDYGSHVRGEGFAEDYLVVSEIYKAIQDAKGRPHDPFSLVTLNLVYQTKATMMDTTKDTEDRGVVPILFPDMAVSQLQIPQYYDSETVGMAYFKGIKYDRNVGDIALDGKSYLLHQQLHAGHVILTIGEGVNGIDLKKNFDEVNATEKSKVFGRNIVTLVMNQLQSHASFARYSRHNAFASMIGADVLKSVLLNSIVAESQLWTLRWAAAKQKQSPQRQERVPKNVSPSDVLPYIARKYGTFGLFAENRPSIVSLGQDIHLSYTTHTQEDSQSSASSHETTYEEVD